MVAVVATAVAAGLVLLGSPGEERSRLLDARRVADLREVTLAVRRHYRREGALPNDLGEILANMEPVWLEDPRSGEPYGYRPIDDGHFELCATFERKAQPSQRPGTRFDAPFRHHDAGAQCFRISVVE